MNNNDFFLTEEYIIKFAKIADLDNTYIKELLVVSELIKADKHVLELMDSHWVVLYKYNQQLSDDFEFPHSIKEKKYTYNLLLVLAGVSELLENNNKLKIPEKITFDTLSSIKIWCEYFKKIDNVYGIDLGILNWLMKYLRGEVFRVGRLEFGFTKFINEIRAYENKKSGQLAILANDGYKVSKDGRFYLDDIMSSSDIWISKLEINDECVIGNPVKNVICNEKINLKLNEWELVLKPDDTMLDVHIPAGDSMKIEDCRDSFQEAIGFYNEYFPEKKFKGFQCLAWFLDSAYQELLPETSNIIKFQKEFNLFPINYNSSDEVFNRLFEGKQLDDIKPDKLKSNLQKNAYDYLKNGSILNGGGGFIKINGRKKR